MLTPIPNTWGPWRLNRTTAELVSDRYSVDLERCLTCADVLDWIFQVSNKVWATPAVVAGLISAINDVLHPQSTLCSFGSPKELTRADVLGLVNEVDPRMPTHKEENE